MIPAIFSALVVVAVTQVAPPESPIPGGEHPPTTTAEACEASLRMTFTPDPVPESGQATGMGTLTVEWSGQPEDKMFVLDVNTVEKFPRLRQEPVALTPHGHEVEHDKPRWPGLLGGFTFVWRSSPNGKCSIRLSDAAEIQRSLGGDGLTLYLAVTDSLHAAVLQYYDTKRVATVVREFTVLPQMIAVEPTYLAYNDNEASIIASKFPDVKHTSFDTKPPLCNSHYVLGSPAYSSVHLVLPKNQIMPNAEENP